MGLTKAQRYNKKLNEIFDYAREHPSGLNDFYWRKGKVVRRVKGWKRKAKPKTRRKKNSGLATALKNASLS